MGIGIGSSLGMAHDVLLFKKMNFLGQWFTSEAVDLEHEIWPNSSSLDDFPRHVILRLPGHVLGMSIWGSLQLPKEKKHL